MPLHGECHEGSAAVPEWASALTEAIPAPAAVMSPDGRILHANRCLRLIVGVESEPGRGSTFFFTLPRQKERTKYEKH